MTNQIKNPAVLVAIGLIVTVVTQIVYMMTLGGPQPADPAVGVTSADAARYFTERWTEILTIVIDPPRTAERLRANPLGLYVNAINWSREMSQ